MALCLLALPVLLVLGIFSAHYRRLTKDAFHCLFRTVTLRKCESGLDGRIRSEITGRILVYSPKTAGIVYKYYKLLSWIVLLLFIVSFYFTAVGAYNYYYYGNCNGPTSTGFCVFDPTGKNSKVSFTDIDTSQERVLPILESDDPIIGPKDANLTIIEFGCYVCPYTKQAESTIKKVIEHYGGRVNFQFKTFIIPHHVLSMSAALAANCAQDQSMYLPYHDALFAHQETLSNETFFTLASDLHLNISQFDECLKTEKFRSEIERDTLIGISAQVQGTPTFFIRDKEIVGPKPFTTFTTIIDGELS